MIRLTIHSPSMFKPHREAVENVTLGYVLQKANVDSSTFHNFNIYVTSTGGNKILVDREDFDIPMDLMPELDTDISDELVRGSKVVAFSFVPKKSDGGALKEVVLTAKNIIYLPLNDIRRVYIQAFNIDVAVTNIYNLPLDTMLKAIKADLGSGEKQFNIEIDNFELNKKELEDKINDELNAISVTLKSKVTSISKALASSELNTSLDMLKEVYKSVASIGTIVDSIGFSDNDDTDSSDDDDDDFEEEDDDSDKSEAELSLEQKEDLEYRKLLRR